MALLRYRDRKLVGVEIIPISGDNYKIEFQPYVESGREARETIARVAQISKPFGTEIRMDSNSGRGVIDIMADR